MRCTGAVWVKAFATAEGNGVAELVLTGPRAWYAAGASTLKQKSVAPVDDLLSFEMYDA